MSARLRWVMENARGLSNIFDLSWGWILIVWCGECVLFLIFQFFCIFTREGEGAGFPGAVSRGGGAGEAMRHPPSVGFLSSYLPPALGLCPFVLLS